MTWEGAERRLIPAHCQQEILDRLTKIEVEFSLQRELVKAIHRAIHGNGQDGLLIRHERVSQRINLICWAVGVVYVAVIGMLVKRWMG